MVRLDVRSRRTRSVLMWLGVVLLASVVAWSVVGGDLIGAARTEEEQVRASVEWVGEQGLLLQRSFDGRRIDEQEARRLAARSPEARRNSVLSAALDTFRAKSAFLEGDTATYGRLKENLIGSGALSPELLQIEETLGRGSSPAERGEIWKGLGRLLPLSHYRYSMDMRSGEGGLVDPPLPRVPEGPVNANCDKIGEIYAASGLLREAVDALLESLYDLRLRRPDARYADAWRKIGGYEEEMGEKVLAARAYFNVVHNDPSKKEVIVMALKRVLSGQGKGVRGGAAEVRFLELEKALAVSQLYRECNLHPRALELLSKYAFADDSAAAKARDEIKQEWMAKIVNLHRLVKGPDCVLLGCRVDDVQDWAAVKIPRPSDLFWKPQGAAGAGTKPAGGK
jgi:tetratricopeptide (TPR) repeat protein